MISPEQIADRLTLGATAELSAAIGTQGAAHWLETQLHPGPEPEELSRSIAGLDAVSLPPDQLLARYRPARGATVSPEERRMFQMQGRMLYRQSVQGRLFYAIQSPWQLRELLVDFWFNHFNVFAHKGLCALWVGAFEQ